MMQKKTLFFSLFALLCLLLVLPVISGFFIRYQYTHWMKQYGASYHVRLIRYRQGWLHSDATLALLGAGKLGTVEQNITHGPLACVLVKRKWHCQFALALMQSKFRSLPINALSVLSFDGGFHSQAVSQAFIIPLQAAKIKVTGLQVKTGMVEAGKPLSKVGVDLVQAEVKPKEQAVDRRKVSSLKFDKASLWFDKDQFTASLGAFTLGNDQAQGASLQFAWEAGKDRLQLMLNAKIKALCLNDLHLEHVKLTGDFLLPSVALFKRLFTVSHEHALEAVVDALNHGAVINHLLLSAMSPYGMIHLNVKLAMNKELGAVPSIPGLLIRTSGRVWGKVPKKLKQYDLVADWLKKVQVVNQGQYLQFTGQVRHGIIHGAS